MFNLKNWLWKDWAKLHHIKSLKTTVAKRSGVQKLHCRLDGYVFRANKGKLKGCIHPSGDLPLGWKGLYLGHPISWGPKILWVRTISSISVSNYICIFVLVQRTFFTMPLTKDLYSRGWQICSIEESLAENQKQQLQNQFVVSNIVQ